MFARHLLPGSGPLAIFSILLISLFPTVSYCMTLQSVYDAAAPLGQYTKYMELDGAATYTGGITIPMGEIVCINGHGAILDLQTSTIEILGEWTRLDISHCVIKNGGLASDGNTKGALNFVVSAGNVVNNTFYANTVGIRVYFSYPGTVTVMNNLVVGSSIAGLLCQIGNEPNVSYNDSWSNASGNYLIDCGCSGGGIKPWSPLPGTGEISADPLFVNAMLDSFHLMPASPCAGAGFPTGTDMGAFDNPTDLSPVSWGRIKAMFAR